MTRPGPAYATGTDLLVLHTLRCIGLAGLARVAEATGLPEPDVESELIDLAVAGLVTHVAGDFGGWDLTEAGRAADAERIAGELETAGTRSTVAEAYAGGPERPLAVSVRSGGPVSMPGMMTTILNLELTADAVRQLRLAVAAVFRSWEIPRATTYRELHGIPHGLGTAVTVQAMVFGNRDRHSGSGIGSCGSSRRGRAGSPAGPPSASPPTSPTRV